MQPTSMTVTTTPNLLILRPAAEVGIKGRQARAYFQDILRRNVTSALKRAGASVALKQDFGRLYVETDNGAAAVRALKRVFGIDNLSVVEGRCASQLEDILAIGVPTFRDQVRGRRFAVRAKRLTGATLPAQDVNAGLGALLKDAGGVVDLEQPDVTVEVEIGRERTLLFASRVPCAKGLPVGVGGRALVLLSGGYDSAVAAWRMLRRGLLVDYVFCNLGGGAYERLVLQLAKVLNDNWGHGHAARLHVVDFVDVVNALRRDVPRQYWQVVLKRQMYRAASAIAEECDAHAIVTGEALGQVSSQTLANLCAIESAATRPVLRPLIGHEKQEIMDEAVRIGTAAISRRVREYCALGALHTVVATTEERTDRAEGLLSPEVLTKALGERRKIDLIHLRPADLRAPYLFADNIPVEAQMIDCQDEHGFAHWHAPGAAHWDPVALMDQAGDLDRTRTYLVYCAHGVTSAGVAEVLQQSGFEAYAFSGGVQALRKMVEADVQQA